MSLLPPRENHLADAACRAIPALTVILSILLMSLPLPLAVGAMPNFALLFVIIWSMLQPRLMPPWLAFLLGIFVDLVSGIPLGHSALIFTGAVATVRFAASRFEGSHNLLLDWILTAMILLAAALLSWQLCAFTGRPAILWPLLLQALTTLIAYPLALAFASRVQDRILRWNA